MYLWVQVRALHARRELARHLEGDSIPSLRPVEGDARDAVVTLVGHRLQVQRHDAIRRPRDELARRRCHDPEMTLEHTDVEVGIADERDVEEVLGLWGAARSRYSSTPDTLAVIRRLRERDPEALLVARHRGRVVGTLIAAWR